ncbi:hypothetical protein KSX_40820 [Ktedonospora formicarum]|uniref:Uncharacterized protein n=1 Tax=Ktedonospora formicarum TaxID=2778364 RepID=A0A8J3I5T3_9CHLR|nr:hypothetical protein KSX_40820 [Ktedonospora formicarum]
MMVRLNVNSGERLALFMLKCARAIEERSPFYNLVGPVVLEKRLGGYCFARAPPWQQSANCWSDQAKPLRVFP